MTELSPEAIISLVGVPVGALFSIPSAVWIAWKIRRRCVLRDEEGTVIKIPKTIHSQPYIAMFIIWFH